MSEATTYTIPECNIVELEKRISKLNKRAAKLGVEPIRYSSTFSYVAREAIQPQANSDPPKRVWISEEHWQANQESRLPASDTGRRMNWMLFTIIGKTPSYNGWEFIAVLESVKTEDNELLNIVRTMPGKECPAQYRTKVGTCDHCRHTRYRKETFVVRHEDGTYKAVGSSCIKDFLAGHANPHSLASWAELLMELGTLCTDANNDEYFGGGGGYQVDQWDLGYFLSWASARIDKRGWMSRTAAYECGKIGQATADQVLYLITPPNRRYARAEDIRLWEQERAECTPGTANQEEAENAIEWARNLEIGDDPSSYLANVNTVARMGKIMHRMAGIAASIIPAYRREKEQEVKRQELERRQPSLWVGELGKRIDLTVTCDRVIARDSAYGTTYIHLMSDDAGNDITWFGSGTATVLKEGNQYVVRVTVKKHEEFRGRKQTIVQRLAVVKELATA